MRPLDYKLQQLINKINQTIWENADPKMRVLISRAKTTITDSTYWIVETMRERSGLGDTAISARRFNPYGPPNRIYNIYVENNVVKTALREYPDYLNEKWKDQFVVGAGTACAIAFDGHWELYREKWRLVTDEEPYIFWVDTSGKLKVQMWDKTETEFELASGVKKVKAMRSWKNVNLEAVDAGIVVLYIKNDNKVYYRNYSFIELTGEYGWETETQIDEFVGDAVNINLFITNDYRTGVIIEDSEGKFTWLISERDWAGMAIKAAYITAKPYEIKLDFIEIQYPKGYHDIHLKAYPYAIDLAHLYADGFNEFVLIENIENDENDWGKLINFTVRHDIFDVNKNDFEVVDENNVSFVVENAIKLSPFEFQLEILDFNNAAGDLTITSKGDYNKNEAGFLFDEFYGSFTPTNLEPDDIGIPEVEEVWNE